MPELHARGVELVVELLDAADHVHNIKPMIWRHCCEKPQGSSAIY